MNADFATVFEIRTHCLLLRAMANLPADEIAASIRSWQGAGGETCEIRDETN